jgi:hypothetical protein
MPEQYLKHKARIAEIADWIRSNPDKTISSQLQNWRTRFRLTDRSIWSDVGKANAIIAAEIKERDEIKNAILAEDAKTAVEKGILTKNQALEYLSKIAAGVARKIRYKDGNVEKEEINYPTDGERIKAISEIAKIEGWVEIGKLNRQNNDTTAVNEVKIIFENFKNKKDEDIE